MGRMIRRQVYLDREQDQAVRQVAASAGITESEVLRRALRGLALVEESKPVDPAAWARSKELTRKLIAQFPSLTVDPDWHRDDLYDRE